ncbi:MAG: hypothetical protein WA584_17080 [Pyrinomonadaceae bacterium]
MEKEDLKFVLCINNTHYPASLELHKIYQVITDAEIEADDEIRVIDESGEDYIYPAGWFVAVELPLVARESFLKAA